MEDSSGTDNDAAAFSEDDDTAVRTWWKRIKKTSNDTLTKLKQLNNKVAQKGAAYRTFGDFTGFLDAMGPFLPPPGDSAAKLLSGLCKCVHGAHMNNANLLELQGRCVDLWDLMVRPRDILNDIESSFEAPKIYQKQTSIMRRFTTFLEEVNNYCKAYTREGVMAAAGRFFLHFQHKQRYNELVTRLRNLTNDANLELNVVNKSLLVELKTKISTGMTYVG